MSKILEGEAWTYWCVAGELRLAISDGDPDDQVRYLLDELDAIEMHTDSSTLRDRCRALRAMTVTRRAGSSAS